MRLQRRMQLAALTGLIAEVAFVTPLFLWEDRLTQSPLPPWAGVLQTFQMPGAVVVERLFRASVIRRLTAHLNASGVVHTAQGIVVLLQATLFALLALGVTYAFGRWNRPGSVATPTPT